MARTILCGPNVFIEGTTNLDGVTENTTGGTIDMRWYKKITWFLNCTVNTGAVTVTIQGSIDGTNWVDIDAKTYTAATGNDVYHYGYNTFYPYMRTKTSTQSDSTVTTYVAARS